MPSEPRFHPAASSTWLAFSMLNSNFVFGERNFDGLFRKFAGRNAGAAVDELLHALAVGEQRHRLAHRGVAERKVLAT